MNCQEMLEVLITEQKTVREKYLMSIGPLMIEIKELAL